MATPPFQPDESKPGASDLISLYPSVEQTFRDIIEDWILWEHNTGGTHKQLTLDDIATPTIPADKVGIWHESGVTKTRFAGGTVYNLLNANTGLALAGGTMTGDLVLAGVPDADLKAATKKYVDDADALKADLASPALTGNPTAPTQTEGNDSTRLASTAFVTTAVAASAVITRYTAKATTSGTTKDFASIPAGTNRITVMLSGVSLSGNDELRLRIGDSGGFEGSNYVSTASNGGGDQQDTEGFLLTRNGSASDAYHGSIILTRQDGDTWVSQGALSMGGGSHAWCSGGKTLTAELTQIRLMTTGANSFDAGSFSILTEV